MTQLLKDPLMSSTRGLLAALFWIFVIFGSFAILLAPVMALNVDTINAELANENMIKPVEPMALAITIFIGGLLMGVLAIFVALMRRIVASVAEGDPFLPVNASRLYKMGWLGVGIAALTTALSVAATQVDGSPGDLDFDFSALVLALSLFILARVFRHGAAMREDLEGTV